MSSVYLPVVPLIGIVLTAFAVGACRGLHLLRAAKMSLEVGTELICLSFVVSAFAQATQADAKALAKPLGVATLHGCTNSQPGGLGHGSAISDVALLQLRRPL